MTDAWIIDACRTPRGIGKHPKGALGRKPIPSALAPTVLKALAGAQPYRHRRGRRRDLGHQFAARHAKLRPRPHVGARRGL